jgi:CBS domain-containing protein
MYDFIYYQVRDVMTPSPVTAAPDMSIGDVQEIFEAHDFNGLPVIDGGGRLIGMITKLDVLKAFAFSGKTKVPPYEVIMAKHAERFMTEKCHAFAPDTPLTRVLQRMTETGYKSFPVLEGSELVGIISREDVLTA